MGVHSSKNQSAIIQMHYCILKTHSSGIAQTGNAWSPDFSVNVNINLYIIPYWYVKLTVVELIHLPY